MMTCSLILLGFAVLYGIGRLLAHASFRREVKAILKGSRYPAGSIRRKMPKGIPDPVARYLDKALPYGQLPIQMLRLRHEGHFKTGLEKKWEKIKGEQYLCGVQPGFVWKGQTRLFTALDSYVETKGKLKVWLFSAVRIISKAGVRINQGELLRWLAESALLPSNLLPSDNLQWIAVDPTSATLRYTFLGESFSLLVHFNSRDEIAEIETMRPFLGKSWQKWKGSYSNYRLVEGYYIPMELEACWIIDKREIPYAKFCITDIRFNSPHM